MQIDASDIGLGAILEEEVMLLLMLAVLYQRPKKITVLTFQCEYCLWYKKLGFFAKIQTNYRSATPR